MSSKQLEMNKDFVPYEETLALKKLGFDIEDSLGWYNPEKVLHDYVCADAMSAPLYQQAFRWFREKYRLYGSSCPIPFENDRFFEYNISDTDKSVKQDGVFNSYEEAELACLRKLIEIVKQKNA